VKLRHFAVGAPGSFSGNHDATIAWCKSGAYQARRGETKRCGMSSLSSGRTDRRKVAVIWPHPGTPTTTGFAQPEFSTQRFGRGFTTRLQSNVHESQMPATPGRPQILDLFGAKTLHPSIGNGNTTHREGGREIGIRSAGGWPPPKEPSPRWSCVASHGAGPRGQPAWKELSLQLCGPGSA